MLGEQDRPAHILIVDDHPDNIEVLRARLTACGYSVSAAHDGETALRLVESSPPDLILLDVMMPRMDGNEVARRIKGNTALPYIPIIMQTALDSTANKVEGLGAGADDYITKPINFAELEARVHSKLRIKELHDQLDRSKAALAVANLELQRVAVTDGLTGLMNRRHLEERLREMWEHSQRLHEPLGCVMFDLDEFKSVNDHHGHQAGDEVLRQLGRLLGRAARDIDRVGRYGGEEFLALLPGTVLDAAVTFAERARQEVAAHSFSFPEGTLRRTLSCGVAGWPHPRITDRDQLVKAADDALYVAKQTGKNRVVRFDSVEFNAHTRTAHGEHADRATHWRVDPDGGVGGLGGGIPGQIR